MHAQKPLSLISGAPRLDSDDTSRKSCPPKDHFTHLQVRTRKQDEARQGCPDRHSDLKGDYGQRVGTLRLAILYECRLGFT